MAASDARSREWQIKAAREIASRLESGELARLAEIGQRIDPQTDQTEAMARAMSAVIMQHYGRAELNLP
jgi:hypothetical protein